MHGAAATFARRWQEVGEVDRIVATDMLDLAAFLGLTREWTSRVPTLLYMHENQLTYPLPGEGSGTAPAPRTGRDRHYGFVNFTSMLAADRVAFNSDFHRSELLEALPPFLRHYPDHREIDRVEEIRDRSLVLPVGIRIDDLPDPGHPRDREPAPLVVWNQRWEYDKRPLEMLGVLSEVAAAGVAFRLAMCGERFGRLSEEIEAGLDALGERVVHRGHLPREEYVELLGRATLVLSTALHEFFGIAVLEAASAGAMPLVPDRLAYPEVIPGKFHRDCLYADRSDLVERLCGALRRPRRTAEVGVEVGTELRARYDWAHLAPRYDRIVEELPGPAC